MEWLGSFEIPGSDRRVGGRLVIDESTAALTLFDSLGDRESHDVASGVQIPVVWGVSEDGREVTAVDLTAIGGTMYMGGWKTENWICRYAIDGHIEPQEPMTFSSISSEFTFLSSWLESPLPSRNVRDGDYVVEVEKPELGGVQHDGVVFEFTSTWSTETGFDQTAVSFPTVVSVTPPSEQPLEALMDFLRPIEALLWLATGRFNQLAVRVRIDSPHPHYSNVTSSRLKPVSFEAPSHRLVKSQMLFTASEMPGAWRPGWAVGSICGPT